MKDFSNVTTQNLGQNGYCKFPNGLLIQWGISAHGDYRSIYLPMAFYDSNYIVTSTIQADNASEGVMISTFIYTKYTSYFYAWTKFDKTSYSGWKFNWMAIGRWK